MPPRSLAVEAHRDLVAVHDPAHLAAAQIDILGILVFGKQKTVAIGVGVDFAGNQVLAIGQRVMIFFQPHEPSGAAQVAQRIDDRLQRVAAEGAATLDFGRRESGLGFLGKQLEDFFLRARAA